MSSSVRAELKAALHQYPNFPQEGILFEDFLPLFLKPELFRKLVTAFKDHVAAAHPGVKVDYVVGLEARGFLFGPTLALALDAGFVPIRKAGKLPGKCYKAEFVKEYGKDVFEIQADLIPAGATVLIVDDILATGGTASAAGSLIGQCGGKILEYAFVMELDFLKGRDKLNAGVFTLLSSQ